MVPRLISMCGEVGESRNLRAQQRWIVAGTPLCGDPRFLKTAGITASWFMTLRYLILPASAPACLSQPLERTLSASGCTIACCADSELIISERFRCVSSHMGRAQLRTLAICQAVLRLCHAL